MWKFLFRWECMPTVRMALTGGRRAAPAALFAAIIMGLCCDSNPQTTNQVLWPVEVNLTKELFVTDKCFLSYGMDSNLIRDHWETFDFDSQRLKTLAKGLAPAKLRLMGTDGDRMIFQPGNVTNITRQVNSFPFKSTRFNMTTEDWDNINSWVAEVGWRLIFGINGQTRVKTYFGSQWDPINAIQLLEYSIIRGYWQNMDFEFGNEPHSWQYHPEFIAVSPEQLAQEFRQFRSLLNTQFGKYYGTSQLYGPDGGGSFEYFQSFVQNVGPGVIQAATYHQYYGGAELRHPDKFTDPNILDSYISYAEGLLKIIRGSPISDTHFWMGETSSAVTPTGNDICESYVAGFMLLDKLGVSARLGVSLVIRQTFYGFWFAMIDENLMPKPNYWTGLLFHRLVGEKVLNITAMNNSNLVRLYAHCTSRKSGYQPGSIVVYGMNISPTDVSLKLTTSAESPLSVHQYLLSPTNNNLTSAGVELNHQPIRLLDDVTLPDLKPVTLRLGQLPRLPSMRYGFFVYSNINVKLCIL